MKSLEAKKTENTDYGLRTIAQDLVAW